MDNHSDHILRSRGTDDVDDPGVPLIVDLDGSLIATDLLQEAAVAHLARKPLDILPLARQLATGKAVMKSWLAERQGVIANGLPWRETVLDLIRTARAADRPVYLATASHESWARAIADHLGLFTGVFATDGTTNLSGQAKADALVARFGAAGFDYVGNSSEDLQVWRTARTCYAVAVSGSTLRQLRQMRPDCELLPSRKLGVGTWLRALRVHQYSKNALIFLPVLAAHATASGTILQAALAFIAFSAAASAIYLVNDLIDLSDDRGHPTKSRRPLAAGQLSIGYALVASAILIAISLGLATALPAQFALVLLSYLVMTTSYSFWLKRKPLADVVLLALLYSVRVVAGSAATGIALSNWLLGLCMFAFTSLALVKRYSELLMRHDKNLPDARNRGYRKDDLPVILAIAAATGANAVTILGLYISSPQVLLMYPHPKILWLLPPLLLYLIARALLVAHRREMNDDPVIWMLKDRISRVGLIMGGIVFLAGSVQGSLKLISY